MFDFDAIIKKDGLKFSITRNGTIAGDTWGIIDEGNLLQLISQPPLEDGDILYQEQTKKNYKIINAKPLTESGKIISWEAAYEAGNHLPKQQSIHIGAIHGPAVVGSQQHFSVSQGATLEEFAQLIASKPAVDQESLDGLVTALKDAKEIKPGMFQKFTGALAKYADLSVFLGKILLAFATRSNP